MTATRDCSYEGVGFFFDSIITQTGKRITAHELPLQKDALLQPTGGVTKKFTIRGYLVGSAPDSFNDLQAQIERLENAVNSDGEGVLELAFKRTRLQVQAGALTISNDHSSKADFTLEVYPSANNPKLQTTTQRQIAVVENMRTFSNALRSDMLSLINTNLGANYVTDNFRAALSGVTTVIEDLINGVSYLNADDQERISTTFDNATDYKDYIEVVEMVADVEKSNTSITSFVDAMSYTPENIDATGRSNTAIQNAKNLNTLTRGFKQLFIAAYAVTLTQESFTERSQAVYYNALLSDTLDNEIDTGLGFSFEALTDLTNEAAEYVVKTLSTLSPVVTVENDLADLPVLYMAYRLYGNLDRFDDIIDRNGLSSDPDFIGKEFQAVAWR